MLLVSHTCRASPQTKHITDCRLTATEGHARDPKHHRVHRVYKDKMVSKNLYVMCYVMYFPAVAIFSQHVSLIEEKRFNI